MLCGNARGAPALIVRAVANSKCFLQLREASKKSEKSEKAKRRQSEDKLLFGKLIEKKREKEKRLKFESNSEIQKAGQEKVDSELAWVLGSSHVKIIKSKSKKEAKSAKEEVEAGSTKRDDGEELGRSEDAAKREVRRMISAIDKELEALKAEERKKDRVALGDDILESILDFPVYNSFKSTEDQWTTENEIMSVSPMKDKACLKYPSVTRILTATMSDQAKAALEKWKANMIEKYGMRGFEIYQAELLEEGKSLHNAVMCKLSNKPYQLPERVKNSFNSLSTVFENVNEVRALESHVIHPQLMYRGVVDCVAVYRGNLCLIDWKKSDKSKGSIAATYDAPLQLASYIGAMNSDLKYPFQIKKGVIVVAYTTGFPAEVHEIDENSLEKYWKLWLKRLREYHVPSL